MRELNGLILVWHDADGGQPDYEIPRLEGPYSDDWTEWHSQDIDLEVHPREIVDNLADSAHFGPVHKAPTRLFEVNLNGHIGEQVSISEGESGTDMHFNATYYGPAVQIGTYTAEHGDLSFEGIMLNAHTPVDQNSCVLHFGVMIKQKDFPAAADESYMQSYLEQSVAGFMTDVVIWKNKRYEHNPVLCDGDGPLAKMRKWYNQFYLPVGPESS